MNTITVSASKTYPIHIGRGLLEQLGSLVSQVKPYKKAVIISDSNVWPLYGQKVTHSLESAGIVCCHYVFPAGEASKSMDTYCNILRFLAQNSLTRSDVLIALGGGVTGDMTGFVAATYLRGIDYIQVPTSLLAMVDSSVGGKTAIDIPEGKNLVGVFCQPNLVVCDIDALSTLPGDVFRDGCAEVIKYGILYDEGLFAHLEENGLAFDRESVISRCIALKRDVVMEDERDTGSRQKLNLGHTIGHGVEACSDFTVSHGQSVAIGTAIISRIAVSLAMLAKQDSHRILSVLQAFQLPTTTVYTAAQLYAKACNDKKRSGGSVNLIIPTKIGNCDIVSTQMCHLQNLIEAGL